MKNSKITDETRDKYVDATMFGKMEMERPIISSTVLPEPIKMKMVWS